MGSAPRTELFGLFELFDSLRWCRSQDITSLPRALSSPRILILRLNNMTPAQLKVHAPVTGPVRESALDHSPPCVAGCDNSSSPRCKGLASCDNGHCPMSLSLDLRNEDLAEMLEDVEAGANTDGLERHLYEVFDPSHHCYSQHLTSAEMDELVKPSDDALELVHDWLLDNGIERHRLEYNSAKNWIK
ncbi:MAG: tripeptidyl peptidase [Lasallia pustulata]|uniref:Tripeptidyl peptidase n=1 Tax=Lasallia pustulata TaxID=136370 RepID=A0A5M8PFL1_9LECA|nr:MAG: tripeptidyl peptidase [Lasallia pustulata]